MSDQLREENNVVVMEGYISSEPVLHHSTYGEGIYTFDIQISRLNIEVSDTLRVEVSERLIDIDSLHVGMGVHVDGQFRSYNKRSDDQKKATLELFVFAREIEIVNEVVPTNNITLKGYLCKEPTYRKTPLGREICDLLIAVNRAYGKSDYLPCISWGRNARYSSNLTTGDCVILEGRVQSRPYKKKISEEEFIDKVAYEVSISKMETVVENNEAEGDNEEE